MLSVYRDRAIIHVDMDAFFAAVEQLDNPALRGKPVLVGSDRPRGVVSTASYEARKFGCRSAMPMAVARRLCPQAIVVPVRGWRYSEVSDRMHDILYRFTPQVEGVSIDEAFLDVTGSRRLHGDGPTIARKIKDAIHGELKITASVGVAPNKYLAKLASDFNKPDGLTVVTPEMIDTWLPKLPVERIWGIGPKSAQRLHDRGIRTIGDLRRMSAEWMRTQFGEDAEHFARLARGEDDRPVHSDSEAKSLSQEQTFETDVPDPEQIRGTILRQAEEVARRLRKHGLLARCVTVKIRFGEFKTITRSITLDHPSDQTKTIWEAARGLFDTWANSGFKPVRLIGVAARELCAGAGQLPLFSAEEEKKQTTLDRVVDKIKDRFGGSSMRRGG